MLEDLSPLTKLLKKFLKTWAEVQTTQAQFLETVHAASSITTQDQANIALKISEQLINVMRFKNILHIEVGLEMIVLAMTISSQACNVLPLLTI